LQNRQRHIGVVLALAMVLAMAAPGGAAAWTWPVDGPVLQTFLFDELNPKAPGQHRGISIGSAVGTPVLAPVDATITFAGTVPSGGKTLSLLTEQGLSVTLLHLGSFGVVEGATVAEGQVVGSVGPSDGSELGQPFVYLGVRRVEDPQGYLDPLLFLPAPAVEPPPVEPPAPEPTPAPVAPPPVVVTPPVVQPQPPRVAGPAKGTPARPPAPAPSDAPDSPAPSRPSPAGVSFGPDRPPVHVPTITPLPAPGKTTAPAKVSPPAFVAPQPALVQAGPAPTWLRPLDQLRTAAPASPDLSSASAGTGRRTVELLAAALAALALLLLLARRGRGKGARIIGGHALLPDDTDLLREREPSHRARVHDDRRGRARPAPQAAR
jgi:hypothetical protein